MSARRHRLQRLVDLRRTQHALSRLDLGVARRKVEEAERVLQEERQRYQESREMVTTALAGHDHQGWLLACADAEFLRVRGCADVQGRADAIARMEAAACTEAAAARELRQTEKMLERIQREEYVAGSRTEQRTIDEVARLIRVASSKLSADAASARKF